MEPQALPNSVANLTKPVRYLPVTETAKLIRQALKEAFPEVKFSVRSRSYAGGSSIDVGWMDGPLTKQVEAIAKKFQGGYFDGMTDYKGGHRHALDGEPVRFGGDFVFCNRTMSDVARANVIAALAKLSANDREALLCRLGLANYYKGTDEPEQLAWPVFGNLPAPAFEGRRSPLAESVNLLDSY